MGWGAQFVKTFLQHAFVRYFCESFLQHFKLLSFRHPCLVSFVTYNLYKIVLRLPPGWRIPWSVEKDSQQPASRFSPHCPDICGMWRAQNSQTVSSAFQHQTFVCFNWKVFSVVAQTSRFAYDKRVCIILVPYVLFFAHYFIVTIHTVGHSWKAAIRKRVQTMQHHWNEQAVQDSLS